MTHHSLISSHSGKEVVGTGETEGIDVRERQTQNDQVVLSFGIEAGPVRGMGGPETGLGFDSSDLWSGPIDGEVERSLYKQRGRFCIGLCYVEITALFLLC